MSETPFLFRWRDAVLSEDGPPATRRLVLVTLSTDADTDGRRCFPSTRRLAERTGLSRRSVEEHLRTADEEGWIQRSARGDGRGWKRMSYTLTLPPHVGNEVPHLDQRGEGGSPPRAQDVEHELPHHGPGVGKDVPHPEGDVGNEGSHARHRGGESDALTWGTSRTDVGNEVPLTTPETTPETRDDDVAESGDSATDSVGDVVDGFDELEELYPEALQALGALKHADRRGTEATLRLSFLHPDGRGHPDPCVRGLPLAERQELVARALFEMRDQGVERWSARALAGFVRRLRMAPDPMGDHPGMTAEEEERREQERREAARTRQRVQDDVERLNQRAREDGERIAAAASWLATQPKETQARADLIRKRKLGERRYTGDLERVPEWIAGPVLLETVEQLRTESAA